MILSPARSADIPAMQQVERDAAELFRGNGLIDVDRMAVVGISEHMDSIDEGLSFVAEIDGVIAGFAMGEMRPGGVYLHELDVTAAHQRRGIGAALLERFVAEAARKNAQVVYLSTFRTPPWNAPFYRRMGFADMHRDDHLPWMTAMEKLQAQFLDVSTRVFMRRALQPSP